MHIKTRTRAGTYGKSQYTSRGTYRTSHIAYSYKQGLNAQCMIDVKNNNVAEIFDNEETGTFKLVA